MLFPPLDKKNTCDKAKGLRIASERYIGELGVRCLSRINREQDSPATVSYEGCFKPLLVGERTTIGRDANQYRFIPLTYSGSLADQ